MTQPSTQQDPQRGSDAVDELDAVLAAAESLHDAPLAVHAETFERVHEVLHRRLQDADGSGSGR